MGLGVGLICGLTPARLRTHTLVLIVALSGMQAVTMFANMEWLVPDSNQAFREEMMGRPLTRGSHELPMDGLREQLASARTSGLSVAVVRDLELAFHARWAYSTAPVFVTALALSFVRVARRGWLSRALTATGFSLSYFLIVLASSRAGEVGAMAPAAAAWAPNVACVFLTVVLCRRVATPSSLPIA